MPTAEHIRHAERLREIRKNLPTSPVKAARSVAGKLSLMKYFNPFIDWLYAVALSIALLKDILDLVGIGSLPAIGTVVTLMASLTIWFIMIITGSAFKASRGRVLAKRYAVLLGTTIVEFVFGIDFLPIETFMVIYVFYSTLEDRGRAEQKAATRSAQTQPSY